MKRFVTLLLAVLLCMGCFAPMALAASSCDAVVTASFLNIRSNAGAQYGVVASAPRGSLLTVVGVATENEDWFKVEYNGTVGYADSRYIINADSSPAAEAIADAAAAAEAARIAAEAQAAAAAEAAAQAAAQATPTPTQAPAATAAPTTSVTPSNTASPDADDPTWLVLSPSGASNATVTGELVRFRSTPGGEILGNFNNGARINVTATSGSWYEVNCNGTVGYVHNSFVSLDSAASSDTVTEAPSVQTPAEQAPAATPEPTPEPTPVPAPPAANIGVGQQIVNTAMQYIGVPYVWGGTSPEGFDCSGLVYYVYKQCGYSINRVAHSIYTGGGSNVSRDQLAVGDIICFGNTSNVWHVGIYVGNGQFIHSPYSGATVRVESLSGTYATNFVCGKRIV